jgi:hypothetical protein
VKYLIDRAHRGCGALAREGSSRRAQLPGTPGNLAKMLVDTPRAQTEDRGRMPPATYAQPGVHSFKELVAAARKAQCEESVQQWGSTTWTGAVPWKVKKAKNGPPSVTVDPTGRFRSLIFWSPCCGSMPFRGPIALIWRAFGDGHRGEAPDDVLRWYDQLKGRKENKLGYGWWILFLR